MVGESTNDWKLPWDAGCRCGQVRMRITAPPLIALACHCAGCQRMSASAFSLSLALPASGFEVVQGEPVIGGLHGPSHHFHCPHCKSWLFTRPEDMPGLVNFRASMLDDHSWVAPFAETCRAEGYAWAQTGAKHSFANIPNPEVWGPLVSEYAERGARPG